MTLAAITVEPAAPSHADALHALFRAADSPCHCRFWHFEGANNDWLARCATEPEQNAREFRDALNAHTDEARGLVAHVDQQLVGWLKVAPAHIMQKAYERRFYRKLPCFEGDRSGVYLLGCALVHPDHRQRGVTTALVAGAVEFAPAWGARALEALPRRPREAVRDDELWTGPVTAFTKNGFVEVHAFDPYPVLRRALP